jgi:4-oxalocrotonate tautomerase
MPHVIIKMYPGRTDEQKKEMAARIVKDIAEVAACPENVVSVAIEETSKEDWPEKVYRPDIMDKKDTLVVEPGYDPFT